MNIRRFTSSNTRQAMALVRAEFGNQAIILRTRSVEGGVEIVAMADESLAGPQPPNPQAGAARVGASAGHAPSNRALSDARADARSGPRASSWADAHAQMPAPSPRGRWAAPDRLPVRTGRVLTQSSGVPLPRPGPSEPMSTLSFQQFVRDRLAHREQQEPVEQALPERQMVETFPRGTVIAEAIAPTVPRPDAAVPASGVQAALHQLAGAQQPQAVERPSKGGARVASPARSMPRKPRIIDPEALGETAHALMMPGQSLTVVDKAQSDLVLTELRKMRGLMRSQLFSLARSQPDSVAQGLMRRLRGAGFSATLVRRLLEKIPSEADNGRAEAWIRQLMVKVIRLDAPHRRILERGGIHALVGPTGVGKTTTVAKLAARFALRHGVDAVGLVTLDTYRIGAHDQLRTFGRLLGIPVSVAHDAAGLATFMSENAKRKLILIDTVGVGQRDDRLPELIDSTASASIRKLLVLNAAAQPETLEDVVRAYRVGSRGGIVVSKIDEAVKLGGVVDCLVRHRLPLIGLADGQRVPEDWQEPDAGNLVRRAFDTRSSPVFDFDQVDLDNDNGATASGHA